MSPAVAFASQVSQDCSSSTLHVHPDPGIGAGITVAGDGAPVPSVPVASVPVASARGRPVRPASGGVSGRREVPASEGGAWGEAARASAWTLRTTEAAQRSGPRRSVARCSSRSPSIGTKWITGGGGGGFPVRGGGIRGGGIRGGPVSRVVRSLREGSHGDPWTFAAIAGGSCLPACRLEHPACPPGQPAVRPLPARMTT